MNNDAKINTLISVSAGPSKRSSSVVHTETIVDADGKALNTTTRKRSARQTEPKFMKFYLAEVPTAFDVHAQVLSCLAAEMKYDTHTVCLSDRDRRSIAKACGFKQTKSLTNALHKLRVAGQIKKISSNEYMINPYIFGKGTWEKVSAARAVYDEIIDDTESAYIAHHQPGQYLLLGENRKADDETRENAKLNIIDNRRLAATTMCQALRDAKADDRDDDGYIPFD